MEVILQVILAFLLIYAYPVAMTILNIAYFFSKLKKKFDEIIFDLFGVFPGLVLTMIAFNFSAGVNGISSADYDKAVRILSLHTPIYSESVWIIRTVIVIGYIGLFILGISKPKKLPPLISAFSIASVISGLIVGVLLYIQLMNNFNGLFYPLCLLYLANIIMLVVRRIRFHITEHVRLANERETVYRTKFGAWLGRIMSKVSSMTLFSFALILPIAAIFEILFIIFGQGADGFIKAFTMTADWTFSTQIPPEPIQYSAHYLCTVAAGGHKKIVKPLRYGKRLGDTIIVNRQLLIANAFEDLIAEKTPKFHRAVRSFYDKHGYPVSQHITTPTRADIVYILMKPLEYIFVFVLYLCDSHPENRIAVQYSDYKKSMENKK